MKLAVLSVALLLPGCAAKKRAATIPPGMRVAARFLCVIEANDSRMQPKVMLCDDGNGHRTLWEAK